jgi:hypothetical protein
LENELIALSPGNFDTIHDFFTKIKALLFELKLCNIEKIEEQLILSILSKLGPQYSMFVSSFYTTKLAMGTTWKMPSLDAFVVTLTQEQDKLVHMGALKSSKAHSLATNEGAKIKQDRQEKKDPDWKKGPNPKSNEDTSNPKGGKKKEKSK